jgi:hypothetical protein
MFCMGCSPPSSDFLAQMFWRFQGIWSLLPEWWSCTIGPRHYELSIREKYIYLYQIYCSFQNFIEDDFDFMIPLWNIITPWFKIYNPMIYRISIMSVYSNSFVDSPVPCGSKRAWRIPGPVWLVRSGVLFRRTGNLGTAPGVASGKHRKNYWTWPFIVNLSIGKWGFHGIYSWFMIAIENGHWNSGFTNW